MAQGEGEGYEDYCVQLFQDLKSISFVITKDILVKICLGAPCESLDLARAQRIENLGTIDLKQSISSL
ncbi:hypothetical protein CEXT_680701 [Caerostris extrusa]|uniref:Uncharacterized protein n=1 Tax=Caerostris extrusa TaxID=172846 RepID=A0AAV4VZY1_CAEEX|nr:hypothetical protein CEXT_680701 [Caerostris extrusa]